MKIVVGSGIFGLALAEYFSRTEKIILISNEKESAGSRAAGALLSTKAQCFARDPHFQLKLDGKNAFKPWIENCVKELGDDHFCVEDLLSIGNLREVFCSKGDCDAQEKRIQQPQEELLQRGFAHQEYTRISDFEIEYQNEMTCNAHQVLDLLRKLIVKRGVEIVQKDFTKYEELSTAKESHEIFLCTGAWTVSLLNQLCLTSKILTKGKHRFTVGAQWIFPQQKYESREKEIGVEFHLPSKEHTLKYGRGNQHSFLFGFSKKISEIIEKDFPRTENLYWGYRFGCGHSEIVLEKLSEKWKNHTVMICTGAHKSGYLFAPVLGDAVSKLMG